ncbi:hypothetical protein XA68_11808 [Ophiocordyceps unilateralis]|uniref:Uncharacterized protein n=1 Tax=Ophiocordyceps unilateralis TaxID=268505 RepID=A0A2A9PPT8_OPHUN|nr:hypothetical protein XA68_11808 [Ophiocordyceps unilateralis]
MTTPSQASPFFRGKVPWFGTGFAFQPRKRHPSAERRGDLHNIQMPIRLMLAYVPTETAETEYERQSAFPRLKPPPAASYRAELAGDVMCLSAHARRLPCFPWPPDLDHRLLGVKGNEIECRTDCFVFNPLAPAPAACGPRRTMSVLLKPPDLE